MAEDKIDEIKQTVLKELNNAEIRAKKMTDRRLLESTYARLHVLLSMRVAEMYATVKADEKMKKMIDDMKTETKEKSEDDVGAVENDDC